MLEGTGIGLGRKADQDQAKEMENNYVTRILEFVRQTAANIFCNSGGFSRLRH